jgi:hypothetical protein
MKSAEGSIIYRFKSIFQLAVLIIPLLFNSAARGDEAKLNPCLKCHQDVYMKAVSFKYQHSVVRDRCTLCHIYTEEKDEIITQLNFQTLQRELLVYLDRPSEDRDYQTEVIVTDSKGKKSTPTTIDIVPKNLWETDGQRSSLKLLKLSGVMAEEINKLGFVSAVISWDTDVFATSEIEYRLPAERSDTFKIKALYTKAHTIILDGLKHKTKYYFRAVSRDVYGNTLKSEDYSFDTSEEFSRPSKLIEDDLIPPFVEQMQVFRSSGNKGLYLKVFANKACEISVKIKEVKKRDEKHGPGIIQPLIGQCSFVMKNPL